MKNKTHFQVDEVGRERESEKIRRNESKCFIK